MSRLLTIVCLLLPLVHAVPVLGGRTALQAYTDLMVAFKAQFSELLGVVVTDANIGLGPKGELRYPSNPLDSRWNFPGIGEFQVCGAHGGVGGSVLARALFDCSADSTDWAVWGHFCTCLIHCLFYRHLHRMHAVVSPSAHQAAQMLC
jgi:hypothetical protein